MKKLLTALLLAVVLSPAVSFAQVVVRVGPPAPIVETRGRAPGEGYVWVDGYHRWDGNRYVWEHGRWDRPPHRGMHWEAHHWVHHHNGWVLVEGRWR
jgi:opacity protein-like surface antigen